jgi:HSP20 family protein
MNRSFEEILLGVPQNLVSTSRWIPAVDVYETETAVILHAELPGIDQNDVEILIHGGSLALKGKRHFPGEGKHENYYRIERSYGTFERYFKLVESIDIKKITATFKDGVLTLIMPKVEEAKPQTIEISVE